MTLEVHVTIHGDLSDDDLGQLRSLFDHEYLADHGAWTPTDPYGYSGAQVHVMAYDGARLVGHVGFQPRVITVGDERVTVAGTGGVLVADSRRGTGLGRRLMHEAQLAMRHDPAIEFGYLGWPTGRRSVLRVGGLAPSHCDGASSVTPGPIRDDGVRRLPHPHLPDQPTHLEVAERHRRPSWDPLVARSPRQPADMVRRAASPGTTLSTVTTPRLAQWWWPTS